MKGRGFQKEKDRVVGKLSIKTRDLVVGDDGFRRASTFFCVFILILTSAFESLFDLEAFCFSLYEIYSFGEQPDTVKGKSSSGSIGFTPLLTVELLPRN